MRPPLAAFLLLAACAGEVPIAMPPHRPPPPPRLPPDEDAEDALLRFMVEPPDDALEHEIETAIRLARRQAREIEGYLTGHTSTRAEELRRHRLALLDLAAACDAHRLFRSTYPSSLSVQHEHCQSMGVSTAANAEYTQTRCQPDPPAVTPPKPLPARRHPEKPAALAVRCPRKSCAAKPGARCRGRSGEAMDAPHAERQRTWERQKG